MARRKRSYLPGSGFHITARTHCKEHYFEEPAIRDAILAIVARALRRSDAHLVAFAILWNHYHLVVQQGIATLAQLVQPINREIALAVHRAQGRKGHVFERRFFAKPSADADQMREMIIYTHRNPVRAGLCNTPDLWPWSSHMQYAGTDAAAIACPLHVRPAPATDLRDVMLRQLAQIAPELTLDDLRVAPRTRAFAAIRRRLIASAIEARHRGRDIARFLGIADTTVSKVAVAVRLRPPVRFDN